MRQMIAHTTVPGATRKQFAPLPLSPILYRSSLLQRKCACGAEADHSAKCAECQEREGTLQRRSAGASEPLSIPPIVREVLRSPGQPLDQETRAFMEPRFGHDFSQVRVHTDSRAAESAKEVNARAYTVGNHIAFDFGRYAPASLQGRKLLAHELTHAAQQMRPDGLRLSESSAEKEAERTSADIAQSSTARVEGRVSAGAMQKEDDNPLDEKAKKIIEAAKDEKKGIDQRAIDAVNSIVKTYFDASLVEKVFYDEADEGLTTSPTGKGKDIKGQIAVGKYFVEHIDSFARRVLQVGHELEHVKQQRAGMGGSANKNKREFLAHHWGATQPESAGTGRMPHATRVGVIDESLRNYYCLPEADQKTYAEKKEELLKLRATEETASGREHKDPPTKCAK